jgi:transcriptional regulator with XRE-family HTH domain
MTFSQLHERLRLEMWRRIQRGVVTGKLLAAQTGLRPSHISNFLHRKRKLSLAALDRLLDAQQIDIRELAGPMLDDGEPSDETFAETVRIPLIAQATVVALPVIPPRSVQAYMTLPGADFDRLPLHHSFARRSWERFIGMRISADQASAMEPLLRELTIVVIDRHYDTLLEVAPPRPNLYVLRVGNRLLFRYVTSDSKRLLLRPYRLDFPVETLDVGPIDSLNDLLIGRVCLQLSAL